MQRKLSYVVIPRALRNALQKKDEPKKVNGNKLFDLNLVSLLTVAVSCLTLYISYSTFKVATTEKGIDVQPKIAFKLGIWNNGDADIRVQNMSNIPISINSVYFVHYVLDTISAAIEFEDILYPFAHSYEEIKPYSSKDTSFKSFIDYQNEVLTNLGSLKGNEVNKSIIEARIFYSKKFDGKIYGARCFYAYCAGLLLSNEKEIEEYIKETDLQDEKDRLFAKVKLDFIKKIKEEKFYYNSIKPNALKKSPPALKDVTPNTDKVNVIDF